MDFATLLNDKVELNIVDGLTLPNLKWTTKINVVAFIMRDAAIYILLDQEYVECFVGALLWRE